MNEQQRMEEFYRSRLKAMGKAENLFLWDKDMDGEYVWPKSQLLWEAWQEAQRGSKRKKK